jgi:hypothetical protein
VRRTSIGAALPRRAAAIARLWRTRGGFPHFHRAYVEAFGLESNLPARRETASEVNRHRRRVTPTGKPSDPPASPAPTQAVERSALATPAESD